MVGQGGELPFAPAAESFSPDERCEAVGSLARGKDAVWVGDLQQWMR